MAKTLRIEEIADKYLEHLSKVDSDKMGDFLDNYLRSQDIYNDYEILEATIALLLGNGLVKEVPQTMSVISYTRSNDIRDALNQSAGIIRQCEITDKGRHFLEGGQKLDKVGITERLERRKRNKERLINFGIALATAVGVVLLTEPIKQRLQAKPSEPQKPTTQVTADTARPIPKLPQLKTEAIKPLPKHLPSSTPKTKTAH